MEINFDVTEEKFKKISRYNSILSIDAENNQGVAVYMSFLPETWLKV